MKKRCFTFLMIFAGLFCCGFAFYISQIMNVYASTGSAGKYSKDCTHYCTSWGAGWHYQSFNEFLNWSWDSQSTLGDGVSKNEIVNTCKNVDNATGILRLAFERAKVAHYGDEFESGKFSGLVNVSTGQGIFQPSLSGYTWDKAAEYYQKAKDLGMVNTTWPNTAWICWNTDLECDPDTDPTCAPTTTSGDGEFYSESVVSVSDDYITGGKNVPTSKDGYAAITFSVYSPDPSQGMDVSVDFNHKITYDHGSFSIGSGDYFKDSSGHMTNSDGSKNTGVASTDWTVNTTSSSSSDSSSSDSGNISSVSAVSDSSYDNKGKITFTVHNLMPGESRQVCSSIGYSDKYWKYKGDEHFTVNVGDTIIDPIAPGGTRIATEADVRSHQDYSVESHSGNSGSGVCATIVRANVPSGNPVSPSGGAASDIMFAGESVTIEWDVKAEGTETNRLEYARAIRYLVPANVGYSSSKVTGNKDTSADPCSHYVAKYGALTNISCDNYSNKYWNPDSIATVSHFDADFHEAPSMKVPNEVGAKYCHSYGYHFVPYYGIDYSGFSNFTYSSDTSRAYWYVFDSVCRTIAKKPTAAVWNSGIFTLGGIKTTIAKRYNNIAFGDTTSDNNTISPIQTAFGSWSEFLTVANKAVGTNATGFASGSVLYTGTSKSLGEFYPLTISNTNTSDPGHSGIGINSTLKTRLEAYLKKRASGLGNTLTGISGATGTQIYSVSGNLDITGNVTTSTGPFASIYDLPQVVIFVDGNVNISSSVSRIDAWIIATGEVNTCSGFKSPNTSAGEYGTKADPSGRRDSDVCANQLMFNGPVMASSVKLNRTFGSDPNAGTGRSVGVADGTANQSSREAPAEIFNLRADTYLWAYAQSSRYDSSFTETYSRELAPRY